MLILGENGQRKKPLSIFWYMIELCELYRGNQLPLKSDTWFSSYGGPKVDFDTFCAIISCVYIVQNQKFRTECTSCRGFFKIKTIILCKVIQGHLGAKNCLIFANFYNNFQWHSPTWLIYWDKLWMKIGHIFKNNRYVIQGHQRSIMGQKMFVFAITWECNVYSGWEFVNIVVRDSEIFFIKTIILCKVIQGHLGAKNCIIMLVFITTSSDIVHHSWYIGISCEWSRGTFCNITVMWSKVTKGQLWVKKCLFLQ